MGGRDGVRSGKRSRAEADATDELCETSPLPSAAATVAGASGEHGYGSSAHATRYDKGLTDVSPPKAKTRGKGGGGGKGKAQKKAARGKACAICGEMVSVLLGGKRSGVARSKFAAQPDILALQATVDTSVPCARLRTAPAQPRARVRPPTRRAWHCSALARGSSSCCGGVLTAGRAAPR